jgi:hypothetical protein
MRISVGLELNNEGRALAWALDFPGCFAYGADGPEAILALPRAVVAYEAWITSHAGLGWLNLGDFDLRLVDTWEVFTMNDDYDLVEDGYAINAWFKQDWKPLTPEEVERGLALLDWSRADLLRAVEGLKDEAFDRKRPQERWSIRGILKHVGGAEWWYLDRLGLAEGTRADLPADAFERMERVRGGLKRALPELAGAARVIGKDGEFWSPRKLLRRALWHEIDHREHILKLLRD